MDAAGVGSEEGGLENYLGAAQTGGGTSLFARLKLEKKAHLKGCHCATRTEVPLVPFDFLVYCCRRCQA